MCLGSEPEAVKYVTAENKAEYDIHDVVLPLPGYDILLPDNAGIGGHYIGVSRDYMPLPIHCVQLRVSMNAY